MRRKTKSSKMRASAEYGDFVFFRNDVERGSCFGSSRLYVDLVYSKVVVTNSRSFVLLFI